MRVLASFDVARLLPMDTCISLMEAALAATSQGTVVQPLRQVIELPGCDGVISLMPGAVAEPRCFGAKVVSVFPANFAKSLPSHQGVVVLFDSNSGSPVAILNASEVTARRTAAVSAVATRVLARPDASDLAILGYGQQASTHLAAMLSVRPVRRVRVWGRSRERARAFAERESSIHKLTIEVADSVAQAVAGADLICTTTGAETPVLCGQMVSPGAHLNVVGSSVPTTSEIDSDLVRRSRLFVDMREAALAQGGDIRMAIREGVIDENHVQGEIGEVLLKRVEGRRERSEITLFKSLGLASEDLVTAHYLFKLSEQVGTGAVVEF